MSTTTMPNTHVAFALSPTHVALVARCRPGFDNDVVNMQLMGCSQWISIHGVNSLLQLRAAIDFALSNEVPEAGK